MAHHLIEFLASYLPLHSQFNLSVQVNELPADLVNSNIIWSTLITTTP